MADSNQDLHLEIAHILFIDVVGYSKLLTDDQREIQQQLNQVVRGAAQFRTAEAEGKLVRLPTGDHVRYRLLDSIRAFALEELGDAGLSDRGHSSVRPSRMRVLRLQRAYAAAQGRRPADGRRADASSCSAPARRARR